MKKMLLIASLSFSFVQAYDFNPQMQEYMQTLRQEAQAEDPSFTSFDYARGEKIFMQQMRKDGQQVSCVTCHTNNLAGNGRNEKTNKIIEPLSPNTNPTRFTDVKKVTKWLRRNFRDVYDREGTALEKGDVITYIVTKK